MYLFLKNSSCKLSKTNGEPLEQNSHLSTLFAPQTLTHTSSVLKNLQLFKKDIKVTASSTS